MNISISHKTKVCGIIGDPVEHSMSPAIHNAAFREMGLDYIYIPFRVDSDYLGDAVAGMKAFNFRGMNVTIPHKIEVVQYLDELDPLAREIEAVNTIVNEDGILKGYNTDASGFFQALQEEGIDPQGKRVVVIGAGGASRAISFVLAENGASLVILNRRPRLDFAKVMAQRISRSTNNKVEALELNSENLIKALSRAEMLVNTTPVGMVPDVDRSPVPAEMLRRDLIVYDIVYNPIKTKLLKDAEAACAKTIAGLDMLVWQGAIAFEKWTGQKAPVELMKKEATKLLNA